MKRIEDFLAPKEKLKLYSNYAGVLSNRKWKCRYYTGQVCPTLAPGEKMWLKLNHFPFDKIGKYKAAIFNNLWQLKLKGPNYAFNFEHLQVCYHHWLPCLEEESTKIIDKA